MISTPSAARRRALVIDADSAARNLYRDVLEGCGFTVRDVGSGVAAVTAARAEAPDVVVMDMQLPDVPGQLAVDWLRSLPGLASTPVITLSWRGDAPAGRMVSPGSWIITKPIQPRTLRQVIDRATPPRGN